MNSRIHPFFPLTAAALLAALGSAGAAEGDDDITQLTKPESTVSLGAGYVDSDGARFGQYTGMNQSGGYGLLDADIVKRDDATGTWLKLTGRNLGLENRELKLEHNRQGDWGYYLDFSQTPRYEPYTANTAVTGIGSANLAIPAVPTAGTPVQLKTRREGVGLGFNKWMAGGFDVQVNFRNEEKDGERLFARGTPGAFEFAPEPIHSTTRQIEATLGYTGEQLQLSGGYYGTAYNNKNTALNFTGGVVGGALSTFTPIGLPPDNQSHQLHLSGGYNFTPTTRSNFKVAYTKATQNDDFITGANVPLAPGIGANLDGRVDTTLVQAGITARPLPKLSLLASLRYEDRDDQTPVRLYRTPAGATHNGENEPRSINKRSGKLEASYALPMNFRLTGGIDYDQKKRNASPVRIVSHRDKTDETSYRVELRRSLSETVTGALAYVQSDRGGSDFSTTVLNSGAVGSNLIAPTHLADRKRDKVRLSVNWIPTEQLGLQFMLEEAQDKYSARDALGLGPQQGKAQNYSVDASYAFSEAWQATAWASRNDSQFDQTSRTSAAQIWAAALRNRGDALGLGMAGKPNSRLEIGADLSHSSITDEYQQQAITGAPIASLPDVSTRLTSLKLFGKFAIQENTGVRLDYIYDRFSTDDWTWTTWTYTDGTQLTQSPTQKVHFIGISGYYRF